MNFNPLILVLQILRIEQRPSHLLAALIVMPLLVLTSATCATAMLLHIGSTTPRVGQQGTTVEMTIQGMCIKDAQEIVFYHPGIKAVHIEPLPDLQYPIGLAHGGRIKEQIRCQFEIAPNCLPGEYPFRIRTATELSSLGTFHVTRFPIIDESEEPANSNDTIQTALKVTPNVTVRGRMGSSNRGDVDLYCVPAVAGQPLSVEVDSVRIADVHYADSEYDLAVRILDEAGHELASNDDNALHLQDPMVALKLTKDGFVYVEVTRSVFAPSDRAYSLHIGTNRRPLVAFPLGGQAGTNQTFRMLGDPLGEFDKTFAVPKDVRYFEYFGDAPSPVSLRSSDYPNVLEDVAAGVTKVDRLPVALNGIIARRGETDSYRVSIRKGDRWRLRLFAATLGSPVDTTLRIRPIDSTGLTGMVELEIDDASTNDRDVYGVLGRAGGLKDILDPSVIWEAKADSDYLIEVSDPSGAGGPKGVYRIEMEPVVDAVHTLLASTANDWQECPRTSGMVIPKGNRWTVNVSLPQGQGSKFDGELELIAHGLPAGVRLVAPRVPAGKTRWPVQFIAGPESNPGTALITLEAKPVDASKKIESRSYQSIPFINHSGGDAWRTVKLDQFVLAVTEPAPFSIEIQRPPAALVRGGELAIPIKVLRSKGFEGPIEFQCDWVSQGVGVQPTSIIPAGENQGVLHISGEMKAPLGLCPLVVTASTMREDLDPYLGTGRVRVSSSIVELMIAEPFVELASEPASVRRGERKRYQWTVKPKSPFEGQATVKLLGLPKGVSMVEPLPILTKDSQAIEFQIEATDEALLGSVRDITCEVRVQVAGQQIHQRTGNGTLRIDPLLE